KSNKKNFTKYPDAMLRLLSPPRRPCGLRMDLLCIRVVAYDEFVRYEEQLRLDDRPLHPIPVLLGPNETMVEYERDFELWLAIRNVSLESLQGHPGVERLFRLDHSNSRYMERRRQYCGTKTQPVSYEERGPPDKWRHNEEIIPLNYCQERQFRTRSELLDWRLVSPEAFLRAMEDFGPNGRMYRGEKLRPIAVVLRPGEASSGYELNFQRWLSKKNLTLEMLHDDPEEERRLRQCFAYIRAYELMDRKCAMQRLKNQNARKELSMDRYSKRPRLEFDDVNTMDTSVFDQSVPVDNGMNSLSKAEDDAYSCASSTTISEPLYSPTDFEAERSGVRDNMVKNEAHVISPGAGNCVVTATSEDGVVKPANADIYAAASKTLLKAKQVEADSVEHELIKDYLRVSRQAFRGEAAANNSFSRTKTELLIHVDSATENSMHTGAVRNELVGKKHRQNAALASLIAHEWRDKQENLQRGIQSLVGDSEELSHDEVVAVYDKLQQNHDEILPLRIKLNNRLSWLKATDTDRDAQFQELREISRALDGKLAQRSMLRERGRLLCLDLLRSNEENQMQAMSWLKKGSASNS
ncbi:hypothetical protein L917_05431, partial [Phytophthora nicotianae]